MRVQRRSPRRLVFFRCQSRFQFGIFVAPFLPSGIERFRDPAPADVAGQGFLFLRRRVSVLRFDGFQGMNRVHVHTEFRLRPAFAEVLVRDAEVFGRRQGRRRFDDRLPVPAREVDHDGVQAEFPLIIGEVRVPGVNTDAGIMGSYPGFRTGRLFRGVLYLRKVRFSFGGSYPGF